MISGVQFQCDRCWKQIVVPRVEANRDGKPENWTWEHERKYPHMCEDCSND